MIAENKLETTGIITKEYVHTVIKKRRRDIHKGDCGKVLIIAGSKGMAGAAVLCGLAAYRSGSGLVRIAIDEELFPIIQIGLPEATCVSRKALSGQLSQYDAIAMGPGMGDDQKNEEIIRSVLAEFSGPLVLDADSLNIVAQRKLAEAVRHSSAEIILTPHEAEAARLLEIPLAELKKRKRNDIAKTISEKFCAVSVLKGADTVVAMKSGKTYINSTGNAGMATGGSGDVLTGVIAGFSGQGISVSDAAVAAVFVHGLAGDLGSSQFSQHGLMAGDIADLIGPAIKTIVGK